MTETTITRKEQSEIQKYFGLPLEELDEETFKKLQRQLRSKYHPDNFEKFEDETVQEIATERFQLIESLSEKVAAYLNNKTTFIGADQQESNLFHKDALFAAKKLKIEIRTSDKSLKFHLFGKRNYKWVLYGDKFKIPDTTASIVMDEDHYGSKIGYQESIRMYLTFGEEQPTETVANWIYEKIKGRSEMLLIGGQKVSIDPLQILVAIRQQTFLRIGEPIVR